MARRPRSRRKKQIEKDLARGRARGTPWIPDEQSVNREATRKARADAVIAEDEEGMIGHPRAR